MVIVSKNSIYTGTKSKLLEGMPYLRQWKIMKLLEFLMLVAILLVLVDLVKNKYAVFW